MLDQLTPKQDEGAAERPASYLRVAVAGMAALGAAPLFAVVAVLSNGGDDWNIDGLGPFIGVAIALVVVGAILIRLTEVRAVLLGLLYSLALVIGSAIERESTIGALIAAAIGLLAGFIGTRAPEMRPLPRRGNAVLVGLALIAAVPLILATRVSAEEAALDAAAPDARILASFREGDAAWFLVPGNGFRDDVRNLHLIHVVKDGLRWKVAPAGTSRPIPDPLYSGTPVFAPIFPGTTSFFVDDEAGPITELPDGCAFPRIATMTFVDAGLSCWIGDQGFLVSVPPVSAGTAELTYGDRSVERLTLRRVGGYREAIILSTTRSSDALPPERQVIRFAFRDQSGALVDAIPSMRIAFPWYPKVAEIAGAGSCVRVGSGAFDCDEADPDDFDAIRRARVSLRLYRPDELPVACGAAPPTDWVLVGRVEAPAPLPFDVWSRTEPVTSVTTEVVMGVDAGNDQDSTSWLRPETARVRSGAFCLPA